MRIDIECISFWSSLLPCYNWCKAPFRGREIALFTRKQTLAFSFPSWEVSYAYGAVLSASTFYSIASTS